MEHLQIELIKDEICNYLNTTDKIFLCLTCKRFSEIIKSNISVPYRFSIAITTGNVGLIKQFINDVDPNFVKIAYDKVHFHQRSFGRPYYDYVDRNNLYFHEVKYIGLDRNIIRIYKYIVNECIKGTTLGKDSKEKLLGMLYEWISNIDYEHMDYRTLKKIREQMPKRHKLF